MKECFGVGYMEIPVGKFSIISTEKKKERDNEADSDFHIYDCISFSISPDRLL